MAAPNHFRSSEKKSFTTKIKDFCIPKKGDTGKRATEKMVALIAMIVLIISLIACVFIIIKYQKPKATYSEYQKLLPQTVQNQTEKPNKDFKIDPKTGVNADLSKFYEVNNQIFGYLTIPDTKLSYPIPRGTDNNFYLDRTLYKKYDPFGVPFADYRCSVSKEIDSKTGLNAQSDNIPIYGHSAKDGSFFAAIKKYKDLDFYKKHPVIEFNTIYGNSKYKVVGLFMENVNYNLNPNMFAYHDFIDKKSDKDLMEFVDNVQKRNYIKSPVDILPTDKFITLSTCDYEVSKKNYRVALVARRVRAGEDATVAVDLAKENTEMIMPEGWVKKKNRKNPYVK